MTDAVGQAVAALEIEKRELTARLAAVTRALDAILGIDRPPPSRKTPSKATTAASRPRSKRHGKVSWLEESEIVLRDAGKALHMRDILSALGDRGFPVHDYKKAREIVSGVLSRDAREQKRFTKVGPGTFGLREWANGRHAAPKQRTVTARPRPKPPIRPESETTLKLYDIVRRYPGRTAGEIVAIYESEAGIPPELAAAKRKSRESAVNRLFSRHKLRRENSRYWIAASAQAGA
jgi:hypothetical protein